MKKKTKQISSESQQLILKTMGRKLISANDVINKIYFNDAKKGIIRPGWRFYVHLNKQFAPMERAGYIQQVGEKQGEFRKEKVWMIPD